MLTQSVQDAMNEQIKNELYSAYFYLAMAAYFESTNLKGCARWMEVQAQEEQSHAMKMYAFVNERGGRVELVLAHEQHVTRLIHDLYALALKENDYASQVFLQWYVSEQVEEEANASEIVEQLKLAGDKGHALLMLDRALGQRGG